MRQEGILSRKKHPLPSYVPYPLPEKEFFSRSSLPESLQKAHARRLSRLMGMFSVYGLLDKPQKCNILECNSGYIP